MPTSRLPIAAVLLAVLLAVAATSTLADDWPAFRGPSGSGVYAGDEPLPTEWDAATDFRWTAALPGRGASSPSVFRDAVVVTAYTGYGLNPESPGDAANLKLHTLCFDRATGAKRWQQTVDGGEFTPKATPRRIDHGYATPTAACDASGVYVYFGVNGLHAYDWDGTLRWSVRNGENTAGFGTATSPVLFGDLVIQNQSSEDGPLAAFDKASGRVVWQSDEIPKAWSTPTILPVAGDADPAFELVMNHKDRVRGFDPATGKELWSCDGIDDYIVPVVVGADGIAYCFGGRQNRALAIRLGGRGDVTETHRLWMVRTGANVTSPVLHQGKLFCLHDKGLWVVLDAADGSTLAKERTFLRSRVYPSVVLGDRYLYAQTRDEGLLVLKPTVAFDVVATNRLEPASDDDDGPLWNAGPALADGVVYLRSDSTLYAIGND